MASWVETADRWRLVPRLAAGFAVALVAAAGLLGVYSARQQERQAIREATTQAQILAATVTAALAFDDNAAAQEYVSALRANPQVRAAGVYDEAGRRVAGYARAGEAPAPARLNPAEGVSGGRLTVAEAVAQDDVQLGHVYLRTEVDPLARRLVRYTGLGLLLVMAALLLLVLGAAHAVLRRANRELEQRADELAAANRSLQAEMEERGRVEEALRQSQKMEAIGQLTGGVAHDFNNLLTIVRGNLELLLRRLPEDEERLRRMADNAMQGVGRAATLTQRLLAFSRRQALQPKTLSISRSISGMTEMLTRTLGEDIQVETVFAAGLWNVEVDPSELESALLNLAVNARDAMPGGGKLTIETSNAYLDEAYAAAQQDVRPGQYVLLSVSDTGSGMSPEVKARVFEPFFTTKEVGQGTGLGLSQVYGFVKQSGGHVQVYSEPGEGTTLKLYLPRDRGAAVKDERPAAPAGAATGSGETILVLEDDEEVRAFSVEVLSELGYRVLEAADGPTALQRLEADNVDLLFTDVVLPGGLSGRQVADRAVEHKPGLKVLYTSGYSRNAIVHQGRLDAGVQLIVKPFAYADLAARVRALLDS